MYVIIGAWLLATVALMSVYEYICMNTPGYMCMNTPPGYICIPYRHTRVVRDVRQSARGVHVCGQRKRIVVPAP